MQLAKYSLGYDRSFAVIYIQLALGVYLILRYENFVVSYFTHGFCDPKAFRG